MTLHIIAAIVDTRELTLYLKDGSTKKIPQGDPKLAKILEAVTPQLLKNKEAFYDEPTEEPGESDYVEFEGRTNGVVKFFKIAKDKLMDFLSAAEKAETAPPVEPTVIGDMNPTMAAISEIMVHAEPMKEATVGEKHSVMAVVNGSVIPNVDALATQIANSNVNKTIGLENFMRRVASVPRKHSVSDLMKFMERGDLPIANDGSIIIYKVLSRIRKSGHDYVDCHTNNVPQSVGSYVCMDESLVDPNRNNECSNGLHVARRGYIKSFSGDVCVLAKVAPEDVIAVPQHDANKMRVKGYHILFELPADAYRALKADNSMTNDPTGKVLLGKAITGDHVGKLEEVRINGHMGNNITFKKLMDEDSAADSLLDNVITSVDATAEALVPVPKPDEVVKAPVVTAKAVIADVVQTKDTLANLPTRVEKAAALYNAWVVSKSDDDMNALIAFKKSCKCSWQTLGLPELFVTSKEVKKVEKPTTQQNNTGKPLSRSEKALAMLKNIKASKGAEKVDKAEELASFKKQCKCSYEALGLQQKDIDLVNRLLKK